MSKSKRHEITTVNTLKDWKQGLKSQVERWNDNMEGDEEVVFILGEFHKDKFPKYSLKTPSDAAGSISKAGYAPDVFQEDKTLEAFKSGDKEFFGLLTMKKEDIAELGHPQVYTLDQLLEKIDLHFERLKEEHDGNFATVGGVAYDGYQVSAANSGRDYKRFNKQKYDAEIFNSSKDDIGNLGRNSRLDWYGTIIVKEKYLTDQWQTTLRENRGDEE